MDIPLGHIGWRVYPLPAACHSKKREGTTRYGQLSCGSQTPDSRPAISRKQGLFTVTVALLWNDDDDSEAAVLKVVFFKLNANIL